MQEPLNSRVRQIFDEVIDVSNEEREARLAQCCGGDTELHNRVASLLRAAELDDPFLRDPSRPFSASCEPAGSSVGPFELVELLGEGGFGAVYRARQKAPIDRVVAVKIIKAGMDTQQVIARFELERRTLALMDHPNIARVLEAGATARGRPFFVMELVEGERITEFCDRQRLPIADRLALFRQVCGAVQHAHQKGIIHRDLKPSNVLVAQSAAEPVVKVIDFGVAKAISPADDHRTITQLHQRIGTPDYMSPEQLRSDDACVDTRSDIYSLGVLLYELLTGSLPFGRSWAATSRSDSVQPLSRDKPPQSPSARLRSLAESSAQFGEATAIRPQSPAQGSSILEVANRRQIAPATLVRTLQRDLDWVVLKCLEIDRSRRYDSAAALADDLGRYLADQPVVATPPSASYRLLKFVRRNRIAVMASAAIASTLLIAAIVSVAFAASEARQRLAAEQARNRAQTSEGELREVAAFQQQQLASIDAQTMGVKLRANLLEKARTAALKANMAPANLDARIEELEKLLAGSDFTGLALDTLRETVFNPALQTVESGFDQQPLVKARLLQTLATTLRAIGLYEDATAPQEQALSLRRKHLGDDHADTLSSLDESAVLLIARGKPDQAETCRREALATRCRVLGADHSDALRSMIDVGGSVSSRGQWAEAEQCYRSALRDIVGRWEASIATRLQHWTGWHLWRTHKATGSRPWRLPRKPWRFVAVSLASGAWIRSRRSLTWAITCGSPETRPRGKSIPAKRWRAISSCLPRVITIRCC